MSNRCGLCSKFVSNSELRCLDCRRFFHLQCVKRRLGVGIDCNKDAYYCEQCSERRPQSARDPSSHVNYSTISSDAIDANIIGALTLPETSQVEPSQIIVPDLGSITAMLNDIKSQLHKLSMLDSLNTQVGQLTNSIGQLSCTVGVITEKVDKLIDNHRKLASKHRDLENAQGNITRRLDALEGHCSAYE